MRSTKPADHTGPDNEMKDRKTVREITEIDLSSPREDSADPASRADRRTDKTHAKGVKLARLVETIKTLTEQRFTGYIKVNFTQGGIGRVEKFEEILK
jgi:hypothetical protein